MVSIFKNLFKTNTETKEVEEWFDEDFAKLDFSDDFKYYSEKLKEAIDNKAEDLIRFYKREIRKL